MKARGGEEVKSNFDQKQIHFPSREKSGGGLGGGDITCENVMLSYPRLTTTEVPLTPPSPPLALFDQRGAIMVPPGVNEEKKENAVG